MERFHGNDLQELLRQDSSGGAIILPQARDILPSEYLAAYALRIRQAATASYQHELAVVNALSRASTYGTVDIGRSYPPLSYNTVGLPRLADLQEMQGLSMRHPADVLGGIPVAHPGIVSQERRLEMMNNAVRSYPKEARAEEPNEDVKKTNPRCKKPKEMPKRPLSAYNIFFKEERNNILDSIPSPDGYSSDNESEDEGTCSPSRRRGPSKPSSATTNKKKRKPHGKIGFENLAKTIGARWKSLSPDRLAHYKSLAEEDMIRYKKEMKEYSEKEARKSVTHKRQLQQKEEEEKEMKRVQEEELRKERERVAKRKRTIEALMQETDEDSFDQCEPKKRKTETTTPVENYSRSYLKRALSPPSQVLSSPPDDHLVMRTLTHPLVNELEPSPTLSMVHRMSNNSILLKQVREAARVRHASTKSTRGV